MTVSSEGRKVPSCGCASVRAFYVASLPAGGRTPMHGGGASGPFCHGEICAFMPITDLIDSGFESIVKSPDFYPGDIDNQFIPG
ncbi:hypothetical protein Q3A80_28140 [Burkholderia sp. SR8]|jgi:hypothetical protein|uniref:hypothetical protein n=1 Tax=Burkholderia sp. SR8 TaxID=3062277 RepID=UPI004063E9A8